MLLDKNKHTEQVRNTVVRTAVSYVPVRNGYGGTNELCTVYVYHAVSLATKETP